MTQLLLKISVRNGIKIASNVLIKLIYLPVYLLVSKPKNAIKKSRFVHLLNV